MQIYEKFTYIQQNSELFSLFRQGNAARRERHPQKIRGDIRDGCRPFAVLFKIALHYETSMALVTFCFGSAFGMVTVRMTLLCHLYLNPFGAEDATFVITVASGAWTAGNGIAVGGEAAGKQVNAFPAADSKGEVNVAYCGL